MQGTVIKNTGSWYLSLLEDGTCCPCKIKGNFRIKGIRTTNPVAVGDKVEVDQSSGEIAYITRIYNRKNYIIRKASNLSKESHILAANIDLSLLIITLKNPETTTTFIDRFLATAEAYSIPVLLVFNKCDLYDKEELEYLTGLEFLYRHIGYETIRISAKEKQQTDQLLQLLNQKITLLSGHSGVGKSTLINVLIDEQKQKTSEISDAHHKGTHTTTFSEMLPLKERGYVIDTPGIKGFGTFDFKKEEVAHYFRELFLLSCECKFNNCTHLHEPDCAVLKGVEERTIARSRYDSYLSVLEDASENRYR